MNNQRVGNVVGTVRQNLKTHKHKTEQNFCSVLLFIISLYHTMYCPTKSVEKCQCCQQRAPVTNAQTASDLFGYHHPPKVVNTANYSRCFLYRILLYAEI